MAEAAPAAEAPSMTPAEAWEKISKAKSAMNWYVVKLTKKKGNPKFAASGEGGHKEFIQFFEGKDEEIMFGLLKVLSMDAGGSFRIKFVYVRFVGTNVPTTRKAKATTSMGKIDELFPVKHLSFDLDEHIVDDDKVFGLTALVDAFLRVGGAHKPDAYNFGPDQEVKAPGAEAPPAREAADAGGDE